jgi:hypothetical protein
MPGSGPREWCAEPAMSAGARFISIAGWGEALDFGDLEGGLAVGVCQRAFDVERVVDLLPRIVHVRVIGHTNKARRRALALGGAEGLMVGRYGPTVSRVARGQPWQPPWQSGNRQSGNWSCQASPGGQSGYRMLFSVHVKSAVGQAVGSPITDCQYCNLQSGNRVIGKICPITDWSDWGADSSAVLLELSLL